MILNLYQLLFYMGDKLGLKHKNWSFRKVAEVVALQCKRKNAVDSS